MYKITEIIVSNDYESMFSQKEMDLIEKSLTKQINDRIEQLIRETLCASENITASESTLREADFKIKTDPQIKFFQSELLRYATFKVSPNPVIITTA